MVHFLGNIKCSDFRAFTRRKKITCYSFINNLVLQITLISWWRLLHCPLSEGRTFIFLLTAAKRLLGLLLGFFLFRRRDFVTTIWRHNHSKFAFCSSVHAISTEVRVWRHFLILVELVFLLIRVIKFLVTLDLPHSQKWLPNFEIDCYLI